MAICIKVVCCAVVLLSLLCDCLAIHCYYCNSANNSACLDVNMYDEEMRSKIIPIVNCDTAIPSPVAVDFFCRKIVQTIFSPQKPAEVRVTRGCGWIRHHKDCYKDDNSDHLGTSCQCFTDMCNSADAVDPVSVSALFLLMAACLYLWR